VTSLLRAVVCGAVLAGAGAVPASAQGGEAAEATRAYLRAVAEFFRVPADELRIFRQWRLEPEEVPVVLFVARRAGVSPDVVAGLRAGRRSWGELAARYGIGMGDLHVRPGGSLEGTRLEALYRALESRPRSRWDEVSVPDDAVVALVNARVLARVFGVAPAEVLRTAEREGGFVEAFAALRGR